MQRLFGLLLIAFGSAGIGAAARDEWQLLAYLAALVIGYEVSKNAAMRYLRQSKETLPHVDSNG